LVIYLVQLVNPGERYMGDRGSNNSLVSRRKFLGLSASVAAGAALSGVGAGLLSGCGSNEWKARRYHRVIFHNCGVFDGIRPYLQRGLGVVVEWGRIGAVTAQWELENLEGATYIDLKGATLMPGMIDNHVHITVPFMYDVNLDTILQMDDQIRKNFKSCVMKGVTTVRDLGGFPGKIKKFKELSDNYEIPGPRVYSSLSPIAARDGARMGAPEKAPYFTNPVIKWLLGGNYAERAENLEEIETACREMTGKGAHWLKTLHQDHSYSYNPRPLPNHSEEGYRLIARLAHENDLKCALHEPLLSGFRMGVATGFDTLEHMPMDGIIPDRYIEKFVKQDMAMVPTLMAYGDVFIEDDLLEMVEKRGEEFLVPEAVKQMKKELQKSLAQEKEDLSMDERKKLIFDRQYLKDMHKNQVANLQKLYRAGATIAPGTDLGGYYSGFFGRFTEELKRYVNAGIPNGEVLKMATYGNAKVLDRHNRIGSIKPAMYADLIAVDGNPLEDISTLDRVKMVMKGGGIMRMDGDLST